MSSTPLGPGLILLNGKVFTAAPACRYAQAVAISGERISAVGTTNEIAAMADTHTRRIDLAGRVLIPGINDSRSFTALETNTSLAPAFAATRAPI